MNGSVINEEEEIRKWNTELARDFIWNNYIIVIYLLFGVLGNSFVIYFYQFKMKNIKLDNRYFITPLAVLDMLACIIGSSQALMLNLRPVSIYSEVLCKTIWFSGQSIVGASGLLLAVIAVQRYLKVCRPFGFQLTLPWKRAAIVAVIVLSAGFSSPSLILYGRVDVPHPTLNITGSSCSKFTSEYSTMLTIYNIVIFLAAVFCIACLSICYGLIGRTIYIQMKKHGKKNKYLNTDSRHSKSLHSCSAAELDSEVSSKDQLQVKRKDQEDEQSTSTWKKTSLLHDTQTRKMSVENSSSIRHFNRSARRPTLNSVKKMFANHKYSWMFMTITIVFVIAFIPWNVITTLEALDPMFWNKLSGTKLALCFFVYRLYLINHMANPFIYGFFDGAFRQEMKKFVCRCKRDDEDEG